MAINSQSPEVSFIYDKNVIYHPIVIIDVAPILNFAALVTLPTGILSALLLPGAKTDKLS